MRLCFGHVNDFARDYEKCQNNRVNLDQLAKLEDQQNPSKDLNRPIGVGIGISSWVRHCLQRFEARKCKDLRKRPFNASRFRLSTKLSPKSPEIRSSIKSMPKIEPRKKRKFAHFFKCCDSGISPEDSVNPVELGGDSVTH
ncbi:Uncharacterized protein Fot_07913 [Forsythia ovata]|uniref:Uncharacterized protein n=1 Tax=Forsythia ovata TaxID=205694 RepID=A0ABD1WX54_9LAMI